MTSPRTILYLLLALAVMRGLIYASFVPPWQAPDEPPQFERAKASLSQNEWAGTAADGPAWYAELAKSLFDFNFYDFLDTPRLTYSPDDLLNRHIALYREVYTGVYGSRLTYAAIGWPLFFAKNQAITQQLYLVRLNIVLMNAGIILLAYLTARTIFPNDDFLAFGVPALILFNPQHTHLLSAVNNGNLAELLATAALFFAVKGTVRGFSWFIVFAIVGFTAAAMWTKATAYFLPFPLAMIGIFYLWKYKKQWYWLLPGSIVLAGMAYYIAPGRLTRRISGGWSLLREGSFYLDPIVPQDLFRSFWAMPGWTIFYVHPIWYQIIGAACILALIGLMMLAASKWSAIQTGQYQRQIQALAVLAVAIVVAIGVLLAWNGLTHSIVYRQGRSIYPVIVPISLLLMLGWRQYIPQNWRKAGLLAMILAFCLFDSLVLFHYLIPFFYSRY